MMIVDPVEAWYQKFAADIAFERGLDADKLDERKTRVEMELAAVMSGALPPTRIFGAIRAHVVMSLAEMDEANILSSLQITAEKNPTAINYLLLWATHRHLGHAEWADKLRDKVGLPDKE